MDVFTLNGKIILITGASSGIGKQTALTCSQQGATLIITGRDQNRLEETLKLLHGSGHQKIVADLTNEEAIKQLIGEIPKVDGVVHSAGITAHMPARFIKKKNVDQLFKINFEAPVLLTAALLAKKKINKGGSVVFMSSIASKYPFFGGALYSSSKSAIEAYSKTLALELAPKKIRANCLQPSFVKGPMVDGAEQTVSAEVMEKFEKMLPLGFGEPDDVANTIVFFLSEASKWITGSTLTLGGG
ncbi:MAG: SDR family oxidoreductase [Bacteroidota bacterium]|nr:SDR family oxidoreductase [Bacteroidota bacterium]